MSISDFFKNILGSNLINKLWSWGAINPNTNQLFLKVWEDHLQTINGVERISILKKDPYDTSNGFKERKRHIEKLLNGAEGYGVLCTAKDIHTSGNRAMAKFNHDFLLKFGELIDDDNRVYARIIDRIPVKELAHRWTECNSVVSDLKSILATREGATTKEALANARIGQGAFRAQVLAIWDSRCCVTGSMTLAAIRASHIKPWRDSNNRERLDANNGLPLIGTLDALFDAGLITFAQDGSLLISRRLDNNEKKRLGLSALQLVRNPNDQTAEYLAYHRESVFVDD
jgi:putative restriction endonuclease